jgi:hypothetical protein
MEIAMNLCQRLGNHLERERERKRAQKERERERKLREREWKPHPIAM